MAIFATQLTVVVARLASAYKVKRRIQNRKFNQKSSPNSSGGKVSHNVGTAKREPCGSSDEEEFEGTVHSNFAFFDPKSDDFHGVKGLLMTFLDHQEWDISGFADLILSQTTIGTIVKIEEDDTPNSIVTALNLERYKDHKCIKQLSDFLLKVCKDKDIFDNLRYFFKEQAQNVELLVFQRVVNLPPQLLPPLYDAVFDEISWPTEDEHMNGGQQKAAKGGSKEATIFIKAEDEIFYQLSSWSFKFPLRIEQLANEELKNYGLMGLVMAVEAEKISTFRRQLRSLISES